MSLIGRGRLSAVIATTAPAKALAGLMKNVAARKAKKRPTAEPSSVFPLLKKSAFLPTIPRSIDYCMAYGMALRPYLRVYGQIINVGKSNATNCRLHVVAHQSGGVVAIDAYIDLGNIAGETAVVVDTNIYYIGEPLNDWSIETQWTG